MQQLRLRNQDLSWGRGGCVCAVKLQTRRRKIRVHAPGPWINLRKNGLPSVNFHGGEREYIVVKRRSKSPPLSRSFVKKSKKSSYNSAFQFYRFTSVSADLLLSCRNFSAVC